MLAPAGHCTTAVKSECGCDVTIAIADSGATTDYETAVARYLTSCTPTCLGCPPAVAQPSWSCIQTPTALFRCFPDPDR
jgi:hypothetical protein